MGTSDVIVAVVCCKDSAELLGSLAGYSHLTFLGVSGVNAEVEVAPCPHLDF